MIIPATIPCLLCGGVLPSVPEDVYLCHLRDHHRTYFNCQLLFSAAFLDPEGMEKTQKYVISLTRGEDVEEILENVDNTLHNDVEQRIFEGDMKETTENIGTKILEENSNIPDLHMEIEGMENIVEIMENKALNDDDNLGDQSSFEGIEQEAREITFNEETLCDIKGEQKCETIGHFVKEDTKISNEIKEHKKT